MENIKDFEKIPNYFYFYQIFAKPCAGSFSHNTCIVKNRKVCK